VRSREAKLGPINAVCNAIPHLALPKEKDWRELAPRMRMLTSSTSKVDTSMKSGQQAVSSWLLNTLKELWPANYAAAYAGLADASVMYGFFTGAGHEIFDKARSAGYKALAIDSQIPEPHISIALADLVYFWNFTRCPTTRPRSENDSRLKMRRPDVSSSHATQRREREFP
jgi:hypothetical protein